MKIKVDIWTVDWNPCGASYVQGRLKYDPREYANVYITVGDKEERIHFDTNKVKKIKKELEKILRERYNVKVKRWKREFYEEWGNPEIFCARAGRHMIYIVEVEENGQEVVEVVRDWGEIGEGLLHRLYVLAEASEEIFAPEKPHKKLIIKFKYIPSKTEEKAEFAIPAEWGEEEIKQFEEVLWKIMTIY